MARNSPRLINLWPSDSRSNWNFEMLVFEEREKVTGEKPLGARMRINNKLNPRMTPSPGIEPGPHWWEANAQPLGTLTNEKFAVIIL